MNTLKKLIEKIKKLLKKMFLIKKNFINLHSSNENKTCQNGPWCNWQHVGFWYRRV